MQIKNLKVFETTGSVYNKAIKKLFDKSKLNPENIYLYMRARFQNTQKDRMKEYVLSL